MAHHAQINQYHARVSRMKNKNHMLIAVHAEKNSIFFMIKIQNKKKKFKISVEGMYNEALI